MLSCMRDMKSELPQFMSQNSSWTAPLRRLDGRLGRCLRGFLVLRKDARDSHDRPGCTESDTALHQRAPINVGLNEVPPGTTEGLDGHMLPSFTSLRG